MSAAMRAGDQPGKRVRSAPRAVASRRRGEEYLLQRQLFRRRSTGEVPVQRWLQFSWPPRWHYDVLRCLDYFRRTGEAPDERVAEAVHLVRDKRQPDGTWRLENTHPGETHFEFEDGDGHPSRWNTLRALRVLDWYDRRRCPSRHSVGQAEPSRRPRAETFQRDRATSSHKGCRMPIPGGPRRRANGDLSKDAG